MTELEEQLLDVWRQWPQDTHRDRRMVAYAQLGLSETQAVQIVNRLLSLSAAYEYDPVTVARLRRVRDSRAGERHEVRGSAGCGRWGGSADGVWRRWYADGSDIVVEHE